MNHVDSYIFTGNSRANSSLFVTNNAEVAVGAPFEVPAELGAVVVVRLSANQTSGKFQFRYQVVGLEMSPFEAFYSDKPAWALYATLGAVAVAILLILIGFCVCCSKSACCKKQSKPQDST